MKKFDLFSIFKRLGLFGFSVVEDDGAGADNTDGDIDKFDVDVTDDKKDTQTKADDIDDKTPSTDMSELEKRLADAEAKLQQTENEKILNQEISKLTEKHSDFSADKIKEKLQEIAKTDPDKAEMLNNPLGWELLHIENFKAKEVDNDTPSFGRNVDPVALEDEIMEKVGNGGAVTFEDKKNVVGKYF